MLIPQRQGKEEAFQIWMEQPHKTFVCVEQQHIFGTYYLKPNNIRAKAVMFATAVIWFRPTPEGKDWRH